jgi:hypothetical protein
VFEFTYAIHVKRAGASSDGTAPPGFRYRYETLFEILWSHRIMKTTLAIFAAAALMLAANSPADAKGCIKGAVVGGVAGHYAGHHGVLGAAAGCLYGRHRAKEQERAQQQQSQQQAPSGQDKM